MLPSPRPCAQVYSTRTPHAPLPLMEQRHVQGSLERARRRHLLRLERSDDAGSCMLDYEARFTNAAYVVSSPAIDALIMQVRYGATHLLKPFFSIFYFSEASVCFARAFINGAYVCSRIGIFCLSFVCVLSRAAAGSGA